MTNETEKTVSERVRPVLAKTFGVSVEQIANDALTFAEIGADSLDLQEMLFALEDEFEIEIHDSETEGVATIGDVVAMVERLVEGRAKAQRGGSQMHKDADTAAELSAEIQKIADDHAPHIAFSALAAVIAETACDCANDQSEALSKTDETCVFARNLVLARFEDEECVA
jgi:acyl carrier protein